METWPPWTGPGRRRRPPAGSPGPARPFSAATATAAHDQATENLAGASPPARPRPGSRGRTRARSPRGRCRGGFRPARRPAGAIIQAPPPPPPRPAGTGAAALLQEDPGEGDHHHRRQVGEHRRGHRGVLDPVVPSQVQAKAARRGAIPAAHGPLPRSHQRQQRQGRGQPPKPAAVSRPGQPHNRPSRSRKRTPAWPRPPADGRCAPSQPKPRPARSASALIPPGADPQRFGAVAP